MLYETIDEYQSRYFLPSVYSDENFMVGTHQGFAHINYGQRSFNQLILLSGITKMIYDNEAYLIEKPTLLFIKSNVSYSFHTEFTFYSCYYCAFTDHFFESILNDLSISNKYRKTERFRPDYKLTEYEYLFFESLFKKVLEESQTAYHLKSKLVKHYIAIIFHELLKSKIIALLEDFSIHHKLINDFFILLENQFPLKPGTTVQYFKPKHFAEKLMVHVNYLNQILKEVTGKTTSQFISDRIMIEAKKLLSTTDWPINEIAYLLGYEFPSYFTRLFKNINNTSPVNYRKRLL